MISTSSVRQLPMDLGKYMNVPIKKVYIVDDDVSFCKALQWLLEPNELQVEVYHSGKDFLAAYQPHWAGCVLIDVRMPEMSGLQVLEKLTALGNHIPVIMMSGHADVSMAAKARTTGAVDFISKPFNDYYFLEQIKSTLSEENIGKTRN